jgi:hypothetical protein
VRHIRAHTRTHTRTQTVCADPAAQGCHDIDTDSCRHRLRDSSIPLTRLLIPSTLPPFAPSLLPPCMDALTASTGAMEEAVCTLFWPSQWGTRLFARYHLRQHVRSIRMHADVMLLTCCRTGIAPGRPVWTRIEGSGSESSKIGPDRPGPGPALRAGPFDTSLQKKQSMYSTATQARHTHQKSRRGRSP